MASIIAVVFQPITTFEFFKKIWPVPVEINFIFFGKFLYSSLFNSSPIFNLITILLD